MSTVLIIGASRGLGRGLADEHHRRGWDVIGTVRKDSDALPAPMRTETLDVTDLPGIVGLRDALPGGIERLFVVAGVRGPGAPIGEVTPADFADTMVANVLGPLWVVDRLLDRLDERATVAVMSSSQGSIELNERGDQETYRISKAGLNMGLRSVAVRRRDAHTYLAVNPGWVKTDMTGDDADITVDQSVREVVDVLDARSGTGGLAFVDHSGNELPW